MSSRLRYTGGQAHPPRPVRAPTTGALPAQGAVMLVAAGTVVTAAAVHRPGWLEVRGGRIAAVGPGAPPYPPDVDLPRHTLVPGFVDQHCHGGGGGSYTGGAESAAQALAFHRANGTTTTLASLVTATPAQLVRSLDELTGLVDSGDLAGVHLEGPWLAPSRAGAHTRALLRDPDPAEVALLLTRGAGIVRMVTLAPERPGAMDAIRRITEAGVVAAIGHTDADYETTRAAIAAGARAATHTFNAMAPLHHRHPGPILALLEDPRVTCEAVADGVHLHPAMLRHLLTSVGAGRVAAVTDAMAAAGMPDGVYSLGGEAVTVRNDAARLTGTATLAGSTATMDVLFRATLGAAGFRAEAVGWAILDAALQTAVALTASTPARLLGLTDVGDLAPTRRADLVILDSDHHVAAVLRRGLWVSGSVPSRTWPEAGASAQSYHYRPQYG